MSRLWCGKKGGLWKINGDINYAKLHLIAKHYSISNNSWLKCKLWRDDKFLKSFQKTKFFASNFRCPENSRQGENFCADVIIIKKSFKSTRSFILLIRWKSSENISSFITGIFSLLRKFLNQENLISFFAEFFLLISDKNCSWFEFPHDFLFGFIRIIIKKKYQMYRRRQKNEKRNKFQEAKFRRLRKTLFFRHKAKSYRIWALNLSTYW